MSKWYVYIIENKLSHFYTGICTDIDRRFSEHQASGPKCAKALKGKGPLTLKLTAEVNNQSEALQAEIWVKKLTKAQKLKLLKNELQDAPIVNTLAIG
ncbi:GIY-YIG nuclease family protein [Paraglaciecola aestuariivivens]